MKNLLTLSFTALCIIFITSCSEYPLTAQGELNLEAYSQLKVQLNKDLTVLANEFSKLAFQEKNFKALDIACNYYGKNSKQLEAFNHSFSTLHNSAYSQTASNYILTNFQSEQINMIISEVEKFNGLSELKNYLNEEFDRYATTDLSIEDKNFILTFIASFDVSFEFVSQNPHLFQETMSNERVQGFWGCIAGIAGGVAVTTAVVGALINPPLWVLAAADWYLVASAGAASIATIASEC